MYALSNAPLYKVISLLTKIVIFVLSICYVFNKIDKLGTTINFSEILPKLSSAYFIIALVLVIVNWGIEAFKWKYLIQKLEQISFLTAFKSILSGVTISIFTPNRVGEFAGRVFYLKSADKIKATFISLIGSAFQLLITVISGFLAITICYKEHTDELVIFSFINKEKTLLYVSILILIFFLGLILFVKKNSISQKIKEVLSLFNSKELFNAFTLSLLRYIVFSFQYYLVLKAFGINVGVLDSFQLIALTFFVSSAIPSFSLTEITVRGASSLYFFSMVSNDTTAILASSVILWIINLAIPALIGALFIWDLKFFKD